MTYKSGEMVAIKKGTKRAAVVRSAYEKVWKGRGWSLVESNKKVTGAGADTGTKESNIDKKEA